MLGICTLAAPPSLPPVPARQPSLLGSLCPAHRLAFLTLLTSFSQAVAHRGRKRLWGEWLEGWRGSWSPCFSWQLGTEWWWDVEAMEGSIELCAALAWCGGSSVDSLGRFLHLIEENSLVCQGLKPLSFVEARACFSSFKSLQQLISSWSFLREKTLQKEMPGMRTAGGDWQMYISITTD